MGEKTGRPPARWICARLWRDHVASASRCSQIAMVLICGVTVVLMLLRRDAISSMHEDIEQRFPCYPHCTQDDVREYARKHDLDHDRVIELETMLETAPSNLKDYPLDYTPPAIASTQRERTRMECGLTGSETFTTLPELRAHVAGRCRPLRHCAHKTAGGVAGDMFFGAGEWRAPDMAGDDNTQGGDEAESGDPQLVFNPHKCWMYQFRGDEPWAESGARAVDRVAVLLGPEGAAADAAAAALKEASSLWDRFFFLAAEVPSTLDQERDLQRRIAETLAQAPHGAAVTVAAAWRAAPERERALVRLLLRVVNTLDLGHVDVVWIARPYAREGQPKALAADMELNEEMNRRIQEVHTTGTLSGAIAQRPPLPPASPDAQQELLQTVAATALVAPGALDGVLLVDVRDMRPTLRQGSTEAALADASLHLPGAHMMAGQVPNVHRDTPVIVFDGGSDGRPAAEAAARALQRHGFSSVRVLAGGSPAAAKAGSALFSALRRPTKRDTNNATLVASPLRLYANTKLRGLDLFAPTLNAPPDVKNPGSWPDIARFLANALLNTMYRSEIMGAGEGLCGQRPGDCSDCLAAPGRVPSRRITFEVMAEYFHARSTPTVIALEPSQRIWQGDWAKFLKENGEATLTVRRNYSTAKTRVFDKEKLKDYLRDTRIVARGRDGKVRVGDEITAAALRGGASEQQVEDDDEGQLPLYAGNNKLNEKSMRNFKFKYPDWVQKTSLQTPAMWLGPRDSLSSLHVDHTNRGNLAYQVLGAKRWQLFPPFTEAFMYGRRVGNVVWSQVIDPAALEPRRVQQEFPEFRLAVCDSMHVDVEEGEMLYNPDGWWHVVYNTKSSLMLNFWLRMENPEPKEAWRLQQEQQQQMMIGKPRGSGGLNKKKSGRK